MSVLVHPRVLQKRGWLAESELVTAWDNAARLRPRQGEYEPPQMMALGWDGHGRLLEMIAYLNEEDEWVIFHAAPAQKKFLKELGVASWWGRRTTGRRMTW